MQVKPWIPCVPAVYLALSAILSLGAGLFRGEPLPPTLAEALIYGTGAVVGMWFLSAPRRPFSGWRQAVGWTAIIILFLSRHAVASHLLRVLFETAGTVILWAMYPVFTAWVVLAVGGLLLMLALYAQFILGA